MRKGCYVQGLATQKRARLTGVADGAAPPGDATMWAATLKASKPILQADSGLFSHCLAAAQQQGASAPAAFQVRLKTGSAVRVYRLVI